MCSQAMIHLGWNIENLEFLMKLKIWAQIDESGHALQMSSYDFK